MQSMREEDISISSLQSTLLQDRIFKKNMQIPGKPKSYFCKIKGSSTTVLLNPSSTHL